jgi:APA family basic amino acid/polyamine antiporter
MAAKLKKALGLFETTMYGIGIILGAGIYVLIGKAAGIAGNMVWLSFLISAIIASFTGLSYAELSSMFPKSAAEYLYTRKATGSKLLSFVVGWLAVYVIIVASAAVSLGFGGYVQALTGFPLVPAALLLIVALSLINFWGIKESSMLNIIFTAIEVFGLLMIIFLGAGYLGSVDYFEAPAGALGVMTAAVLVFFAYLGFEDLVNVSEEVKNAPATMPKALILSIAITTVLYMLVSISAVSIMPWEMLGASHAPLADVANTAMPGSAGLLSGIALFATANTVLFLLIAGSRILYGMSREHALHKSLSSIHPSRKTPWLAVAVICLITLGFALLGNIRVVAELTDFGAFIVFMVVNLSVILLRFRQPQLKRPFKVPFSIGKLPIIPALGVVSCFAMLFYFNLETALFGLFVIGLGAAVYMLSNRKRVISSERQASRPR